MARLADAAVPLPGAGDFVLGAHRSADARTGKKVLTWFALDEDRPLFAFAGIWCTWRGIRGTQKNPVEGEHMLYGFLTTAPNAVVAPVHSKAMPAILTTEAECDAWLSVEPAEALKLQRPLPGGQLTIVARGEREDPPPAAVPNAAEPTLL